MRLPIRLGSANARRAHGFGSVVMPVLALVALLLPASANSRVAQPDASSQSLSASQAMARVPVSFEPNAGQFDPQVKFVARHAGPTVFFTQSEAVFVFSKSADAGAPDVRAEIESEPAEQSVVRMGFSDANTNAEIEASGAQEGVSNYLIGSDPAAWRTNVPNYSRITYRQIYDGIDLTFYENDQGRFEYDFIVAPGADPGRIAVKYESNGPVSIGESGELSIPTTQGAVSWAAPVSFQNGSAHVNSAYVLRAENEVGFEVGDYDPSQTLVLDPQLGHSTYLGGSGSDEGRGVATDSSGRAYVVGYTSSTNFPTAYPFQGSNAGSGDVLITKFNAAGSAPTYSTYLGGSSADFGDGGVAVDSTGSAYVTGYTSSTNFPTVSPYQASNAGGTDAFVAKINPVGSGLYYSTYLGGGGTDLALGVAFDSGGSVYVAGDTNSTNFPTASPYQASNAGGTDAFVTKFNAAGSALTYSTYLGGSGSEYGYGGVAIDAVGSAYLAGYTTSTNFPTVSPYQTSIAGSGDTYVTKFNAAGSALTYSTYLGGSGSDLGYGVAVDSSGSAYVTGSTGSTNFPTASPYQASNAGGIDAFVTKFNAAGSALTYSTYLGGSSSDYGYGISVDSTGSAYVAGYTSSTNFPTSSPYQASNGGSSDVFVTKFNAAGSAMTYSTYLGGSGNDIGYGISVDSAGSAYVTGYTSSTNFPTASPYQASNGGSSDVFLAKITNIIAISGTFAGGTSGSISVYDLSGNLVTYWCCMSSETWSVPVPQSAVCPTNGYRVLWSPADTTKRATWYNSKASWGSADVVCSPSSGNDMTVTAAGALSGYVKNASTAADLDGAVVYAFDASTGEYEGYGVSGEAGTGRFQVLVASPGSYKLLIAPPPGYVGQWYSGSHNYGDATAVAVPSSTANFSLEPASSISGYVKDMYTAADLNGYPVYVYTTGGEFFGQAVTNSGFGPGRYQFSATSGSSYKLVSEGGPYSTQWWSGASGFGSASATIAPATANFSLGA